MKACIWIWVALLALPSHAIEFETRLFKKVGECKATGSKKPAPIYIVKQWHLAPGTNTRVPMKKVPDQAVNLSEVETQLAKWIAAKKVQTLIAEGCEGKFDDALAFNGWSLKDLRPLASEKEFESVVTHPALKLEAKFGDALDTRCGDAAADIQAELLAFSDARADIGYATRLKETQKDPKKQKIYLDGVIEAYHLPPGTPADAARKAVIADLQKNLKSALELNHHRSLALARAALAVHDPVIVLVGGLHATDIQKEIETQKRDCQIFEPVHFEQETEKLVEQLQALAKGL